MNQRTDRHRHYQPLITYTTASCDLGYLLVAVSEKGICAVEFGDRPEELVNTLTGEFKQAKITQDNISLKAWLESIIQLTKGATNRNLPLDLGGTAFQQQVWQALQSIPYGQTRTYQEIAHSINKPNATRAIGSACGANSIALIIPCHRVIRSDGGLGGYRWGIERKQKLLEIEKQVSKNR